MLSKSLIQFSVDGWGCVPSLLFACLLCTLSRISPFGLCATLQTAAHQAPPSAGFSRQEYWSVLPFLSPCYLPGPNYGGGNTDNGNLLQKVPCRHCYTQCPHTWSRPLPTQASAKTPGHSRPSLGQSLVGSLLLSPGSWHAQGSVCALQESVSAVLCKFWRLYGGVNGGLLQEGLRHTQVCCI